MEHGLQDDGKEPAGAVEVALPERVAGIGWQRRMQHAGDLGARCEPARDLEAGFVMTLEADIERAQAAQAEIGFLGAGADAEDDLAPSSTLVAEAASAEVMAPSMASAWPTMYLVQAEIETDDAVLERLEIQAPSPRCCP